MSELGRVSRVSPVQRLCATVRKMKEGPSRPAVRFWPQTAASCCRQGRATFDGHCFERLANGLADFGRSIFIIVFWPFCMAYSLVMAGGICRVRQDENQSM